MYNISIYSICIVYSFTILHEALIGLHYDKCVRIPIKLSIQYRNQYNDNSHNAWLPVTLCTRKVNSVNAIINVPLQLGTLHYTSAPGILQCIISPLGCTQWLWVDNTQSCTLAYIPGQHGNILFLRKICLSTVEGKWSSLQMQHFDAV